MKPLVQMTRKETGYKHITISNPIKPILSKRFSMWPLNLSFLIPAIDSGVKDAASPPTCPISLVNLLEEPDQWSALLS